MRSANPALSEKTFRNLTNTSSEVMTLSGVVNKCFILLALVMGTAIWSWQNTYSNTGGWSAEAIPQIPQWYLFVAIGAFIVAMIIAFKPHTAPYLAPAYALGEGLLLGAISALFDYKYPGIAMQAVLCTMGVFVSLLLLYKSRIIPVTNNIRLGIVAATGGVMVVYLIDVVLNFFGHHVPFIHDSGPLGIGVSAVIVVIAALNLILDFDFIEQGAESRAPKYMEWYAAFGLLVTLIWLYLEILRLLAKTKKK